MNASSLFQKSAIYKNFQVIHATPLPEIQCQLIELEHTITKARVIHIANDDDENLFCIGFQTIPHDSKGAAHILEHTVLCGSKKYPIKDPFFSMLRRSLNTFMNAMTGPDFTCYPASSQVEKDFYNLLEVYLDAVFYPELKKNSFLQEGHRLEFTDSSITSPLTFKGIVYNEMKGALSSPDERLWHTMLGKLFPDITYRFDSGGDPKDIIHLSYEELLQFHSTFYHPSHALFFFYGNIPLEKHLDFIEEKVLKNFHNSLPSTEIGFQKPFTHPVECTDYYPVEKTPSPENKTLISFGFLTCPITDQKTLLALTLLDIILMDTDAAPLKRALMDSKLCSHVDAVLETEISQAPWVFIFKGCNPADKKSLYQLFQNTLKSIIENPLPQDLIDAAIHQIEFSRLEMGEDGHPYGLSLFMRACLPALHKCPPEEGIKIHSLIDGLRKELKNPQYLTHLLQTYLIDNPHCVHLDMQPDPLLEQKEESSERALLKTLEDTLTDEEKKNILLQTEQLQKYQDEIEKQSVDCLPILQIEDIPPYIKTYSLDVEQTPSLSIYHHSCFTNKILYADLLFPLPDLGEFDLPMISFFCSILTEIGCGGRSYEENLNEIQTSLGDLKTQLSLYRNIHHSDHYTPVFSVRAKCLSRNAPKLFSLVYDLITSPDLDDEKRIFELLEQHYIILQNSLPHKAMRYASLMAASGIDLPSAINNQWFGLPFFEKIVSLKKDPSQLISTLKALREKMLSWDKVDLVLSCDKEDFEHFKKHSFYQIHNLPSRSTPLWSVRDDLPPVASQGRMISTPVFFSSQAYKTISYLDPHAPSLILAANLMDHLHLHRKIREQGGAYGSGANFSPQSGLFTFYSYRDPHLMRTYKIFDEAINLIVRGDFTAEDLLEAKLAALQGIDAPISPGQRAIAAYGWDKSGRTPEVQAAFRQRLINTTKKGIRESAEKHLLPLKGKATNVTFGSKALFKKKKFPHPTFPV